MSTEQQTAKWERWNSFVSLNWYDSLIEFLFRFVAKTSEPLLALGIVISAADFLDKGQLMRGNPGLALAWAWCQAIAIEASSGVVFVYALQSFKSKDKIKGWVYLALSVLLAITGGAMLLLQLVANLTTMGESALPGYVVIGLAVLRVVVSIGYVYMCRAKHIRFTDLEQENQESVQPPVQPPSMSDETANRLLGMIAEWQEWRVQVSEQLGVLSEQVTLQAGVQPRLPEHAEMHTPVQESAQGEQSIEQKVRTLLAQSPDASYSEVSRLVPTTRSTAKKYVDQIRMEQVELNGKGE